MTSFGASAPARLSNISGARPKCCLGGGWQTREDLKAVARDYLRSIPPGNGGKGERRIRECQFVSAINDVGGRIGRNVRAPIAEAYRGDSRSSPSTISLPVETKRICCGSIPFMPLQRKKKKKDTRGREAGKIAEIFQKERSPRVQVSGDRSRRHGMIKGDRHQDPAT